MRLVDVNEAFSVDETGVANTALPFFWALRFDDPKAGRITPAREWLGRGT